MASEDIRVPAYRRVSSIRRPGAREAFERKTAWPMMGLILVSLALLLIPDFMHVGPSTRTSLIAAEWAVWLLFVAEYVARVYLAIDRRTFVQHHVVDLVIVILPMIPALRVLRIVRLLRMGLLGARTVEESNSIFHRSSIKYAALLASIIVLLAAVMVWSAERADAMSQIHTLPDAIWWSISTVTTVGYGDKYPITLEGKMIAVTLMILGIAVFGLVSAALASLFVENGMATGYDEMKEQLDRLERKLDAITSGASAFDAAEDTDA